MRLFKNGLGIRAMNEELGMRKERTTGLLDKLKLLAEASKIGDFDITINCAGLSGEETELICLINEAVGNYRAAVEYDLMKYKLTSDALGIALWDMDVVSGDPVNPNNKFTWSQEFRFMLGYSDEHDFPNILSSWSDKLHPEDKQRTLDAFAAHLNDYTGKIPYDIEYRLLLKNGQYRYFRAFGTTLRNSVGIPLRVAGAVMDINEKKQTENQLMITSSIIQNSPNIAFYKKISGKIIYVNPSGSIITGYTHDELMDDGLNRLFDDEETVKYFANKGASDSRANIIRNEVNAKMQNNELRTFATTSFLVDNDAYATVASDITDAKKSELERLEALKELQHSKETAETLVEIRTKDLNRQQSLMNTVNIAAAILLEPNTDDGLKAISSTMEMVCQSVDADRVFLWQNINRDGILHYKQVCKWMRSEYAMGDALLEYTYDEAMPQWKNMLFDGGIINGPLDNLPGYNPASFSMYALQSILIIPLFLKGEFWGFVSFDDCRHHRSFPEAEIYALSSYGLLVVGAIQRNKIMHDLQVAIEDAKKASLAKSRFIANMNHEMRTPMNAIVGLTDLLLEETGVSDNVKKSLKKIGTAGNTLMGLINDVLDISKIEAGKLDLTSVQYDVPSLLNDIITLNLIRIANKPVTFKLDINEDLPCTLFGDDLRVKQILNNLLSNAFKYTKEGTVTFGVSCQHKGDSEWVSFYVSDTGIGIRADDIDKLFSDFFF
jgi:PAS domain S-box-containing protein